MRNRIVSATVSLGALALGVLSTSAHAEEAPDSLADIVVTAQRRPEQAQNIGVALSVLSGGDLVQRGVSNINQLQYQTPGLEAVPAFGGGQPNFRLRGVGFDDYASNNASPVGVYVDEVAKPFPIQTQGLLFDLERVEVLRGPQGTLYGRNTTGGAINFITGRPTEQLSAGMDAEYGRFGLLRMEGHVSGPVGEGLSVRLAAATEQGGGFQHDRATGRGLGDADRTGLRGQIAFRNEALDVLIEGHYGRDQSDGIGLYLFDPLKPGAVAILPADTSRRATGWGGSPLFQSVTGIAPTQKPFRDNTTYGGHASISLDLGAAKLTSITAYERFRRDEYNDWDASSLAFAGTSFNSHAKTFSQELRLASDGQGPLTWLAGGYYSNESLSDAFLSDFADYFGFVAATRYRQKARVYAGFGQVQFDPTERISLIGGLRVEHERRRLIDLSTTTVPVVGIGVQTGSAQSYTKVSGKAEAEYHLTPTSLLYASVSRGVKSGGFTAYNTLTVDQAGAFKPETLWAYEVGSKNELLGRTLRLNLAAFYYDYRNQQVQDAIFDPVYLAVGRIVNAPKSHIYGAEAELTWRPAAGLEISQGVSWKKGVFDRFNGLNVAASVASGAQVLTDHAGQDEGFPHWNYTGSGSYTLPLGRERLIAQADYSYRDANQPVLLPTTYRVASYWLVNATLSLASADNRWRVGLYGRNIFNKHYDLTRNFFLNGIDIASPGRPASYGVQVHYAL